MDGKVRWWLGGGNLEVVFKRHIYITHMHTTFSSYTY